jgi:hypothetical protein
MSNITTTTIHLVVEEIFNPLVIFSGHLISQLEIALQLGLWGLFRGFYPEVLSFKPLQHGFLRPHAL